MGPDVVQFGDRRIDHRAPLIFDAESIAADDLTDLLRCHSVLSRSLQNGVKRSWRHGYDRAGAAFAEERVLGRRRCFQFDVCAELGRSVLRPYGSREAGFRQGNREATVANVVRRTHRSAARERDQAFLQALFGRQVDRWRLACHDTGDRF